MLRIGYLNVRGLALDKFRVLKQLLLQELDLLFLAETWDSNFETWSLDETFVCAARGTGGNEQRARRDGGIALFARPPIKNDTTIVNITNSTVTIRCFDQLVSGIYFRPSLATDAFRTVIDGLPGRAAIIGDFNASFGRCTGDNRAAGPQDRITALALWCARLGYQLTISERDAEWAPSRYDHVFGLPGTACFSRQAPILTDHPFIICEIPTAERRPAATANVRRFHLKQLDSEEARNRLEDAYENNAAYLEQWYWNAYSDLPLLDVEQRQRMVNDLDDKIVRHVRDAAETALGSYRVADARQRPDRSMDELTPDANASKTARTFKRSMRMRATRLQVSDERLSLEQEVRQHFETVFVPTDDEQQRPIANRPQQDRFDPRYQLTEHQTQLFGTGCLDLAQAFSEDEITKFFMRYKSSKSCGPDGIHTRIIKSLICSKLVKHIALLYQLCATVGITPQRWNTVNVFPLPKTEGTCTIAGCCPIALSAMFRRTFERILLQQMESNAQCARLRAFNRLQAGFRRGHSTLLHAALSSDLGSRFPHIRRAFIDFKQAYDRVGIDLLTQKLEARNTPVPVISLILSMFTGCTLDIVNDGRTLVSIRTYRGLLQGSLLAPFLFG